MGISLGFSRSSYDGGNSSATNLRPIVNVTVECPHHKTPKRLKKQIKLPNPDPKRFKVVRASQVGIGLIAEVLYPDAVNYEGRKILVFENVRLKDLQKAKILDPHFTNKAPKGALVPIARFEPTTKGWNLARSCAWNL